MAFRCGASLGSCFAFLKAGATRLSLRGHPIPSSSREGEPTVGKRLEGDEIRVERLIKKHISSQEVLRRFNILVGIRPEIQRLRGEISIYNQRASSQSLRLSPSYRPNRSRNQPLSLCAA